MVCLGLGEKPPGNGSQGRQRSLLGVFLCLPDVFVMPCE